MSESKIKKERKKQKTMAETEVPKFKPFRQVPHMEPDAKISITGEQFEVLKSFFTIFSEPIHVMQDIFNDNLNLGNISIKYIDNDGKEIPSEEVKNYMQSLRDYLSKEAKDSGGVLVDKETETTEQKDPVLTAV